MPDTSIPLTDAQHDAEPMLSPAARRRLLWIACTILLLIVLVVTPPLLNVNRYQRRIVDNMSASLGRPVHLDGVKMHLLPVPGFTLTNLVISEDPAFGAEPTIRANTVEVSLRVRSLWGRRVEFSRIHFDDPSLNLVRNAAGLWNLESLLTHAATVPSAPTAQATAGDTPRFPYIEATGARVNLKLGDEKQPFSLTEADFALWLPNTQQWHVRLEATPARTDTRLDDGGTVRLEGTLERAASANDVPVDLHASWHDAPLGDASRLVSGVDAGWRGKLHIDAALKGTLGNAKLSTKLTVDELRRADFVPPQMLDVTVDCTATAITTEATLNNAACSLPAAAENPAATLTTTAARVDLQNPAITPIQVEAEALPLPWLFTWLRLVSAPIPADANPAGSVALHLQRTAPHQWSGKSTVTVSAGDDATKLDATATHTEGAVCPTALQFGNTTVADATISGTLSLCGYTFHAGGSWTPATLAALHHNLPQATEGIETSADVPAHLDTVCTAAWGTLQTCTAAKPTTKPKHRR